jgi:hypothetical protein
MLSGEQIKLRETFKKDLEINECWTNKHECN